MKRKLFIIWLFSCINYSMNLYAFPGIENDVDFTVQKGVIYSKSGIPQTPRWFADSRLAFAFEEKGIIQVDYYNPTSAYFVGHETIFLRNLWDGFRYYLVKEDMNYIPEYTNNKIWPFGVESEWSFDNMKFIHRVMAINQSIVFQMITPENLPAGYRFKFDFGTAFALSCGDARDIRVPTAPGRQWKNWNFNNDENLLVGGYFDPIADPDKTADDYTLCCAIGANFPLKYKVDGNINVHQLLSPPLEPGKTYCFIITFGSNKSDAQKLNMELSTNQKEKIEKQFSRYENIRKAMPELISPDQELNSYFSMMPMYNEALKITDYPGGTRAKTSNYWIWGWDGMSNNSSTAYWGDTGHIKNLLKFYKETADPAGGIIHALTYDMKPKLISSIPAQCMYITLLQLYYDQTNDIEGLKDNYEFAKKIFNMALAKEVKETGLCLGLSLTPDFMNLTGETGNDISAFNNSTFYCAARSMNRISAILGDKEILKKTQDIITKIENNFLKYFFDKEKRYIVSSIDASTFAQRQDYQSYSLRWENAYYRDLVNPVFKDCLEFFATNLVCKPGIRAIPLWCSSYDADANQLHGWWPVSDESFVRMVNEFNRKDLMEQWIGWLTYWYKNLTCPEGVSCLLETDEPELDRWSAMKGTWYAHSCREFYQGIIHSIVGVDADAGGITFYPYSGEEMKLLGMHYLGKTFDIDMKGSGPYIEYIEVNGKKIQGTNKLPLEYYQNDKHVMVTVKRSTMNQYPVSVKSGAGIILKNFNYNKGIIKAGLIGAGEVNLNIISWKKPMVKAGGKQVKVEYNEQAKLGYIKLTLDPNKELAVTIMN